MPQSGGNEAPGPAGVQNPVVPARGLLTGKEHEVLTGQMGEWDLRELGQR